MPYPLVIASISNDHGRSLIPLNTFFFLDSLYFFDYWLKKGENIPFFNPKKHIMELFNSKLVKSITKITDNQLKYWVKIGLVKPCRNKKTYHYTFKDIIKLRVIVSLKKNGLSLQRIRKGLQNLSQILPTDETPLSKLIIHTDGNDMIAVEKGHYFSAITKQSYFSFDTEQIKVEIFKLQKMYNDVTQNQIKIERVSGRRNKL